MARHGSRISSAALGVAVLCALPAPAAAGFRERGTGDESLLRAGRMEVGISMAGSWSRSTVTPEAGEKKSTTSTSAYLVPGLVVGYMVTDWLEARVTGGIQSLSSKVEVEGVDEPTADQSSTSGVFALQALAQKDFGLGMAGYVGLGAGGYVGSRSKKHPTEPAATVDWSATGGLGQLLLGFMVQPGPHLLLRGGFRVDLLLGSESPPDELEGESSASVSNAQALAELQIGWRFM